MYRVELYINGQKADLFQNEGIEINLSTQNIKDISKVFGDFTQSFTIPASTSNNAIFKHFYNVDIYGGFDAKIKADAFIEVNNNLFRNGVLELEGVQIKGGEPYAYQVGFYSKVTSLKDSFGEDTLNDLDLSAYDHTYNDTNIQAGLSTYVSGTSSSIIYPLISPSDRWYYNSQNTGHETEDNIAWHSSGHGHGIHYYDLKPAIKLKAIIDAIQSKYGVEFESDFFDSTDFGKLFMWCHRRVGYMFKDQEVGATSELIPLTSGGGTPFDDTLHRFPVTASANPALISYTCSATPATEYRIDVYINGELFGYKKHTGNVANVFVYLPSLSVGDYVDMRLAPSGDGSSVTVLVSANWYADYAGTTLLATTGITTAMTTAGEVTIADQMPEQKVSDFIGSLVRAFNLVIVPTGNGKYDIEPLDDWYAEGTTRDVTQYIDTEEITINKPPMYRRIRFNYNETEAVLGEQYRLQNDIGYGDLRADFAFEGEEFNIEVGFDNMLFERLTDQNTGNLTDVSVGSSITRELEPYIGAPVIFYASGSIRSTELISYVDMSGNDSSFTDFWLAGNTNATSPTSVTRTINFGTEIDPYHLQAFNTGLYTTYWKDYITDLYDMSRRMFMFKGQLPLGLMLALKINDKLTIGERNYIINQMKLNLTTGEAQLELLNDV